MRRAARRRLLVGALGSIALGIAAGAAVSAFFDAVTKNTLGLSSASVNAEGSLSTPAVSGRDVTVSWPADTLSDGTRTTYYVLRDNTGAQGACLGVLTSSTLSCTDTSLSPGAHTYTVVPTFRSWTGASATVTSPSVGSPHLQLTVTTFTTGGGSTSTTVTNFLDNEGVTYCIDASVTPCGSLQLATDTVPASGGSKTTSLTIPAGLTVGSHTVYAIGSLGSAPAGVAITIGKATPTIAVAHAPSGSTESLGASVTYTATVTGPSGDATPSGTVAWSVTGPGGALSCTNAGSTTLSGSGSAATATCTITASLAGSYSTTASVSSDSFYALAGPSTADTFSVAKAIPTIAVSHSPTSPTLGQSVTFTATVSGPSGGATPSGTMTWTLTGQVTSCSSTTALTGTTNVAAATCVITAATPGSYSATASMAADSNYTATGTSSADSFTVVDALHVAQLTGTGAAQNVNKWHAAVTVTVRNSSGSAVSGVTVSGTWNPTASTGTLTCTTNASGQCTISSGSSDFNTAQATESWTVSNLTATNYTYASAANAENTITMANGCSGVCANLLGSTVDTTANTKTDTVTLPATNYTASGATVMILVYRHSAASDAITFGPSTAISGTPTLAQSVNPGGNNAYSLWVYTATGSGTSAGTVVVNFTQNNAATVIDVVTLAGNNATISLAQGTTNSGTSTTASASLTSPGSTDGEVVAVGTAGDPTSISTPSGFTSLDFRHGTGYGFASFFDATAQATASSTLGASTGWGTAALEIKHS